MKDVITGLFILLEDQFSVGDYVKIGQFEGVVLEIGLRTTKVKSWTGEIHTLPNGSIIQVTNYSVSNIVALLMYLFHMRLILRKQSKLLKIY